MRESLLARGKADPRIVRRINREHVFAVLRGGADTTISQIAADTRLSVSAVKLVVDDLVRMGLAGATGEARSSGGRPPTLYSVSRKSAVAVGVDIGTHLVRATCVALDGRVLAAREHALPDALPETAASVVRAAALDVADRAAGGLRAVLGIGVCQPGLVDAQGATVVFDLHREWRNVPLGSMVREALEVPVFLLEDARARLLAEMECGEARGRNHVLYVLIGPERGMGISAAFASDGMMLDGARGFAGEVGHMVLDPAGPVCSCGRRGCWEALGELYTTPAASGASQRFTRLRELVEQGDREGIASYERMVGIHADGVANLVHAFNPGLVVIGGKVSCLGPSVLTRLRAELGARLMAPFAEELEVRLSSSEEDVAPRGAAAAVIRRAVELRETELA